MATTPCATAHYARLRTAPAARKWDILGHPSPCGPPHGIPLVPMQTRLIEQLPLRRGAHPSRDDGMCAMEMVSWLAGEPHSDEPCCSCPVLAALVRAVNDALSDANRNRLLRPLVPQLVHTRGTQSRERQRGLLAVDHLVRVLLPQMLRRQRRAAEADLLADLPPVLDREGLRTASRAVDHYAPREHAARWVLQRAVEGLPPARYVAGLVTVARSSPDPAVWQGLASLIAAMARPSLVAPDAAPACSDC